jgi:hypothetical protein
VEQAEEQMFERLSVAVTDCVQFYIVTLMAKIHQLYFAAPIKQQELKMDDILCVALNDLEQTCKLPPSAPLSRNHDS